MELKPPMNNPGEGLLTYEEKVVIENCAKVLGHEYKWNECRGQSCLLVKVINPESEIQKVRYVPFNPFTSDSICLDLICHLKLKLNLDGISPGLEIPNTDDMKSAVRIAVANFASNYIGKGD